MTQPDLSTYYRIFDQARHDLFFLPKPGLLERLHPACLTVGALGIAALIWAAAWLSLTI